MHWTEGQLEEYLKRRGVPSHMNHVDVSAPPFKPPTNQAGAFALGRLPVGTMNKTEAAYDAHLWTLRQTAQILWHKFEAVKLRLADNTFYTPDFFVLTNDRLLECHEVKGFWQDDARVKIKVAASIYPMRFIAITKAKGEWRTEEFA